MAITESGHWIGGRRTGGPGGRMQEDVDPATGEQTGRVAATRAAVTMPVAC